MLEKLPSKNPPGVDALICRWQDHKDLAARDQLFRQYRHYVQKVAHQYAVKHDCDVDDAKQSAALGFLHALDKYDTAMTTLLTYSKIWMRQYIGRAAVAKGVVSIPAGSWNQVLVVQRAKRDLERKGINPTPETIAGATGLSVERVNRSLWGYGITLTSTDKPLRDEDGDLTFGDTLRAPEESRPDVIALDRFAIGSAREAIEEAAERVLTPRQWEIVRLRIWEARTLEDIGQRLGVTRERIRQVETQALEKLARALASDRRAMELLE